MTTETLKPKIYGYMRVWPDMSPEDVSRVHQELTDYAERQGFVLAEVFFERSALHSTAFEDLMESARRSQTHDVIVPSLTHFCSLHGLGELMKSVIEQIGVHVWVVDG